VPTAGAVVIAWRTTFVSQWSGAARNRSDDEASRLSNGAHRCPASSSSCSFPVLRLSRMSKERDRTSAAQGRPGQKTRAAGLRGS
jgi:hypothetical protein